MDVLGEANSNATVTVWTQDAGGTPGQPGDPAGFFRTIRKNDYFRGEISFNNSTGSVWMNITNFAVLTNGTSPDIITTNTGNALLAKTPQTIQYDADGDLTNDGLYSYSWDAENRLINITSLASVPTNAAAHEVWSYLPDGRWSQMIVSKSDGTGYSSVSTNRFLWDGQVLAAEVAPNNTLIRSYMRGTDLSDSPQGAGGAGGLLEVSYYGEVTTNCFVAYDGNGNVVALLNAADGSVAANYEYDPFGQTIRQTGPMASANPLRFSTQYADDNVKNVKYLYRVYSPSMGRWLSKDPMQDRGGLNLYGFVGNLPLSQVDVNGMAELNLWDDLLGCAISVASDWIKKYTIEADGFNALKNRVEGDDDAMVKKGELHSFDIDSTAFCNGFSFDPGFTTDDEPPTLGSEISKCLLSKLKSVTIEAAVKKVADPKKRKILQKILEKAADVDIEATFKAAETAGCHDHKVAITLKFYTVVTVDGNDVAQTEDSTLGPYSAGASGWLDYNEKYCSCCNK